MSSIPELAGLGYDDVTAARIRGGAANEDPAPATFADGLAGQRVLDAIRRSSREGRWIDIEH